jgi:hypothetical protein
MTTPIESINHFNRLPSVLTDKVLFYLVPKNLSYEAGLDPRDLVAAATTCKVWHGKLQRGAVACRTYAEIVERDYPGSLIRLFKECATPLHRMPLFECKEPLANGLIAFTRGGEMLQPLMRAKGSDGVPGIFFHLQGKKGSKLLFRKHIPLEKVETIFLLYKKDEEIWEPKSSFNFLSNTFTIVEDLHNEYHKTVEQRGCSICPAGDIDRFFRNLLTGKDPLFTFFGKQEGASPLETRISIPLEEAPAEERRTCISRLWRRIMGPACSH